VSLARELGRASLRHYRELPGIDRNDTRLIIPVYFLVTLLKLGVCMELGEFAESARMSARAAS